MVIIFYQGGSYVVIHPLPTPLRKVDVVLSSYSPAFPKCGVLGRVTSDILCVKSLLPQVSVDPVQCRGKYAEFWLI